MDVKNLPWVSGLLQDMGLQDMGAGFWATEDGQKAIYIGIGSVVITSRMSDQSKDFETQHKFPTFPNVSWLMDVIQEHEEARQEELVWRARENDVRYN